MNKEQLNLTQYLIKYIELAQSRGAYQIPESAEIFSIFKKAQEIFKEEETEDKK